ncbi:MAG TPA: DUF5916 domain-containing protein [Thermoanaerobaculia bacterium]|nr:DUF5916 domain-containing protein [Thermoanaerobaculia bacterium]
MLGALSLLGEPVAPLVAQGSSLERPRLRAVRLSEAPVLDGRVEDDPVWAEVAASEGFRQTRPYAGEESSERTTVRVGYTGETLYIAVVCFDRDSKKIIVSDTRRDASLRDSDSLQVILDPFEDRQNGFVFGTNPAGILYDGQVSNEGQGNLGGARFQGGAMGGFNLNWDGVWEARSVIGDFGWSTELAIPFKTLRYPAGRVQSWGINFQRNIRRYNEVAFWAPLDQQFGLYRLSDAGTLTDLEVPVQRNLLLIPSLVASGRERSDAEGSESDLELSVDAKYGVTGSLTLDATYNTDFAQVEVDEQQVNLDRFNLFFPEKRPFFLENAGLFSVGLPGEVDLFFSRRIGIGAGGEPIPIDGGLRLSGKVGATNVGLLAMRTDDAGALPGDAFGAARVSRELRNRSSVGAIAVIRDSSGQVAGEDDQNRTFGIDGRWGIGEIHSLSGFLAKTETPGIRGDEHAFLAEYGLSSPKWRSSLGYLEVAEGFNPEVGFLARRGFRRPSGLLMRLIRPRNLWGLHEMRPHISYRGYWDFDGFQETGFLHLDNHWEWRNGYEVHTGINLTEEGVKEAFEIAPGVFVEPGTYEHQEGQVVLITNAGAPVSFSTTVVAGGFFGGERVSVDSTLRLRRGERLTSEIGWDHDEVELPVGDFEVDLGRLRVSYSFTPRVLLQALVQYNDRTDRVSTNLRFSWLRGASTGLFVVYNEIDDVGTLSPLARPDRSVIVKYSQLIDVLRRR